MVGIPIMVQWKITLYFHGNYGRYAHFPLFSHDYGRKAIPTLLHHWVPLKEVAPKFEEAPGAKLAAALQQQQVRCNETRAFRPFFRCVFFLVWNDEMDETYFEGKNGRKHFCCKFSWDYILYIFLKFRARPKWMPMRRRLPTILMQDPADRMSQLPPEGFNQTTRWCFETYLFSPRSLGKSPNLTHILKWVGSTTN